MKRHEGMCNPPNLCRLIHTYRCQNCDQIFEASIETQYTPQDQPTLPTRYWPACSELCANDLDLDFESEYVTQLIEEAEAPTYD